MRLVNALLVRWAGGYTWVENTASITAENRRVEGFLALGAVESLAEAERVATAVLAQSAAAQISTTVGLQPTGSGDVPFDDFDVADYVTAPRAGVATSLRVHSIGVTEDPEGNPIYTPEVGQIRDDEERQLQRWLKRMANGTLGGSVDSATPISSGGRESGDRAGRSTAAVGAAIRRTGSNQSLPNMDWTTIEFDTEEFDTMAAWPGGSGTSLSVSQTGLYSIAFTTNFAKNGTGTRAIRVIRNGDENDVLATHQQMAVDDTWWTHMALSIIAPLDAGDTIQAQQYQGSGGALNAEVGLFPSGANQQPRLTIAALTGTTLGG